MAINHYQVLGLENFAQATEIKKAYRLFAAKFHPDKHQNDPFFEERFKEIQLAYETLSDVAQKTAFDKSLQSQNFTAQWQDIQRREAELRRREQVWLQKEKLHRWQVEEKRRLRIVQFIFFGLAFGMLIYLTLFYFFRN